MLDQSSLNPPLELKEAVHKESSEARTSSRSSLDTGFQAIAGGEAVLPGMLVQLSSNTPLELNVAVQIESSAARTTIWSLLVAACQAKTGGEMVAPGRDIQFPADARVYVPDAFVVTPSLIVTAWLAGLVYPVTSLNSTVCWPTESPD
jgi:hypothetical protein